MPILSISRKLASVPLTRMAIAVFGLMAPNPALSAESIVGRASVIDADTIEIHGTRIRLFGIDAPESGQLCQDEAGSDYRCGVEAARWLDRALEGRIVTCREEDVDRYGRIVATCLIDHPEHGTVDINGSLVAAGHARAYIRYSRASGLKSESVLG